MAGNQGKGLREWQASLTPEKRQEYASYGGRARAAKLSSRRRKAISKHALRIKAQYKRIRNQTLAK